MIDDNDPITIDADDGIDDVDDDADDDAFQLYLFSGWVNSTDLTEYLFKRAKTSVNRIHALTHTVDIAVQQDPIMLNSPSRSHYKRLVCSLCYGDEDEDDVKYADESDDEDDDSDDDEEDDDDDGDCNDGDDDKDDDSDDDDDDDHVVVSSLIGNSYHIIYILNIQIHPSEEWYFHDSSIRWAESG